ncbi:DUF6318 family protein [Arthrobacter sp. H14]|uniref:DUF6318 family protein n=1 Tax=Arthrobacter sp. H14 TaxID=1312959 RepID=UPI0004796425|nr:DUF6318 family protein [Arthrobacter sp. H14]
MTKNLIGLAAGTAIAALALTGCGTADSESGSSAGNDRPVGASSEGPAQNVRVPQESEPLTEKSEEGLKAFAYYWISYNSYAQQTGKTDKLQELSSGDCTYCADEIDMIANVYEDGGWMAGGDPRVTNVDPDLAKGESTGTALIEYSEIPATIFDSEGNKKSTVEPKEPTVLTVKASFDDGSWTMESIKETPDAELPAE